MIEPIWLPLDLRTDSVLAKPPEGLWTLVHEYVKGPAKLRIQASGTWNYSGSTSCGADGARKAGFAQDSLNASAPLGALIGKIGGSPADRPDSRAFVFVAGSYAVVVFDDKVEGAFYLTMNDQISHFEEHSGSIKVKVEQARS